MSVLNRTVSYFPGITATTQGVEVNLQDLLQSAKHKERILQLRQSDPSQQKQLKEQLPCFTVAGTFNRRCDDGLIKPSGLAAVDLDSAEDYDAIHLLHELKKIDCIAYTGLSCRGQRLFCIVPFKYPDKYVKHYERLLQSFTDMGLPMGDDCHKIISQPRFVSWNDGSTQFFNHNAKPYHLLPAEKKYFTIKRNYQYIGTGAAPENSFQWCMEQINKSHSFTVEKNRHKYIMALARYCNIKGLSEDETLNGCLQFIQQDFPDIEIIKIVKHIYATQSDSHAKRPFTHKATVFKPHEQPKSHPQAFEPPQPKETVQVRELLPAEETNNSDKIAIEQANNKRKTDEKPENWTDEITELEHYFSTATQPSGPVKLNACQTITDISKFIAGHLAIVKANNGNRIFLPYLNRLQELKTILNP
ncbi:MAG: hypothetical protein EPN85_02405 [Bacteroidetes bacterium]|nr:MAG: hypothetical protein EPN85_02405 [Bacteroidota bacterium]